MNSIVKYGTTPVPNQIFDVYLKRLKPAELKLLLIVIRQTLGWQERDSKKRKQRDWLSGSQLREKTGCSRRALCDAIESLVKQGLIEVSDGQGKVLSNAPDRRGQTRLYYRLCCGKQAKGLGITPNACANNSKNPGQNLHITKETPDKIVSLKNQDKKERFTAADFELFKIELEQAGNIENLLQEKAAIKYRDGKRVIVYCEQTSLYRERFFSGYELPGVSDTGMRVPYSIWMELFTHYQKMKPASNAL